jgi:hypothetical protein
VPDEATIDGADSSCWFAVIVTVYETPVGDEAIRPVGAYVTAAVGEASAIETADEAVDVALFAARFAVIV